MQFLPLELKVKVWGGSWSQSASAWEREGGREGTVEIIANVSISRSEKPEKVHQSL